MAAPAISASARALLRIRALRVRATHAASMAALQSASRRHQSSRRLPSRAAQFVLFIRWPTLSRQARKQAGRAPIECGL